MGVPCAMCFNFTLCLKAIQVSSQKNYSQKSVASAIANTMRGLDLIWLKAEDAANTCPHIEDKSCPRNESHSRGEKKGKKEEGREESPSNSAVSKVGGGTRMICQCFGCH